jgi:hypothetical protein
MVDHESLARPERLELPTYWFEASCSIRLSYGRAMDKRSFQFTLLEQGLVRVFQMKSPGAIV